MEKEEDTKPLPPFLHLFHHDLAATLFPFLLLKDLLSLSSTCRQLSSSSLKLASLHLSRGRLIYLARKRGYKLFEEITTTFCKRADSSKQLYEFAELLQQQNKSPLIRSTISIEHMRLFSDRCFLMSSRAMLEMDLNFRLDIDLTMGNALYKFAYWLSNWFRSYGAWLSTHNVDHIFNQNAAQIDSESSNLPNRSLPLRVQISLPLGFLSKIALFLKEITWYITCFL
eukprot:TRINITY_DN1199_c0_g1_i2.p1 TRINITY_DN1199_c0_g1~~TRINITY_DN1199_c0_g1_i2.p1  ORF type:complete len:227 (+),score=38.46 TRINITY_DN1199_c0_g1_i2:93-773(+)